MCFKEYSAQEQGWSMWEYFDLCIDYASALNIMWERSGHFINENVY
jgi:hypothetical protein